MSETNEETATAAKSTFDLKARLQGRGLRSGSITLYLDEVTGEKHLNLENQIEALKLVVAAPDNNLSDAQTAELNKEIKRIQKEYDALGKTLALHSLELTLRAVPDIVVEAARRHARKAVGVKGNIPEDKLIDFTKAYANDLFSNIVTEIRDVETDSVNPTVSVEDIADLRAFIPEGQWERLDAKIGDLQFRNVISEAVTASADFSQAG
jgi:hypothetical protein